MKSMGIIAVSLLMLIVSAGCLGSQAPKEEGPAPAPAAPEAKADFDVISPKDGESITGDSVTVTLEPINVVVKPAGGAPRTGEGHFHITLDTGNYQPTYTTSRPLTGLSPGQHTITVELQNNDHSPMSPPLVKKVTFTVTGGGGEAVVTPPPQTPAPSPYGY